MMSTALSYKTHTIVGDYLTVTRIETFLLL